MPDLIPLHFSQLMPDLIPCFSGIIFVGRIHSSYFPILMFDKRKSIGLQLK